MKKKFLIIGTLALLFVGCRTRDITTGYGYNTVYTPPTTTTTYGNYNTNVGGISGTPVYYTNYGYGYSQPYGYGYGYSYNNYCNPYYYNRYQTFSWPWRRSNCGCSSLNFSMNTPFGSEKRNIVGENLRAQTFGATTEVQYGHESEKLNFFTNESGKTFVSGKVLVEDQLVSLNPKTQKCTSTRNKLEEDPENEVATFSCSDGTIQITAEVLIPHDQQNLAAISPKKQLSKRCKMLTIAK